MKKVAKKVVKKALKKETEFEVLARLVLDGFARVEGRFNKVDERLSGIDERFISIDKRFDTIDIRFEHVNSALFSINHELKEHTVRLDNIERKQTGVLANLDESVHRSEFKTLARRVDLLEKKTLKK